MVCILSAFEKDGPLTPEEMEQRSIAKSKMLGNIKFIGRYPWCFPYLKWR